VVSPGLEKSKNLPSIFVPIFKPPLHTETSMLSSDTDLVYDSYSEDFGAEVAGDAILVNNTLAANSHNEQRELTLLKNIRRSWRYQDVQTTMEDKSKPSSFMNNKTDIGKG